MSQEAPARFLEKQSSVQVPGGAKCWVLDSGHSCSSEKPLALPQPLLRADGESGQWRRDREQARVGCEGPVLLCLLLQEALLISPLFTCLLELCGLE